jgi:hypothetical protein
VLIVASFSGDLAMAFGQPDLFIQADLVTARLALAEAEADVARLRRLLRPYWQQRRDIEAVIARTHWHRVVPVFAYEGGEGDEGDEFIAPLAERIEVTGYRREGSAERAPLFWALDSLRLEYAGLHRDLAAARLQLTAMARLVGLLEEATKKRSRH